MATGLILLSLVDLDALARLLLRFSQLVIEQRWIEEIDINPLLAAPAPASIAPPSNGAASGAAGLIALDARIVLHGPDIGEDQLPRLAIRPYPAQYASAWTSKTGMLVTIRPSARKTSC